MAAPSRSELLKCFIGSNVVALGAGTPYLYSFYAPQLLAKCHLPISKLSTLSLALSIGSSLLGFIAGIVIDRNIVASCLIGAVCTFSAYSILYYCYVNELSNIILISFGLVLVGFGSVSGFYAAVKCCTTNFPHHRGTMGAFPVALYALSGMLFSSFCAKYFGDDIDKVFKFLTIACSSMIFVGCLTLRILVIPKRSRLKKRTSASDGSTFRASTSSEVETTQPIDINSDRHHNDNYSQTGPSPSAAGIRQDSISSNSSSSLASSFQSIWSGKKTDSYIWSKELTGSLSFWGWGRARDEDLTPKPVELPPPALSLSRGRPSYSSTNSGLHSPRRESNPNSAKPDSFKRDDSGFVAFKNSSNDEDQTKSVEVIRASFANKRMSSWKDNHIIQTIKRPRFIAYFLILAILQGIGQMYIYSVGFIIRTQISSIPPNEYKLNPEKIQSIQVSIISILSFLGRLSSGPVSDLLVKKLRAQRLWNVVFASSMMVFASAQMLNTSSVGSVLTSTALPKNITNISVCSAIFGYAFGVLFGTFPPVIADTFGTEGFSTIWGLSTGGGIITVKLFSAILAADLGRNTEPEESYCTKGAQCYSHTFHVVQICAISITLLTSAIIGITYWQKKNNKHSLDNHSHEEFILTEEDEEEGDERTSRNDEMNV